ncbi:MAG: T9SS type A sorting domain-containing protein [Ignavibacteriaceae bacterium]|jgi:hypothetical protein|nr:T9SS type A sorting domain-containing protein [Ignavibacteriaceae bacterium]
MLKQICVLLFIVTIFPLSAIYSQKYLNQYHFKSSPNPDIKQNASQVNEINLVSSFINSQYQSKQKINGGINKIDSIIVNSVSGAKNKLTFVYSEIGRIVSYKTASYLKNGSIFYYQQNTNTYDSLGNPLSVLTASWNGEKWDYFWREDFTYNSEGNIVLQLDQIWQLGKWENVFRVIIEYNSDENLVTSTSEDWVDSVWVNTSKITIEYFSDGLVIAGLFQKWQNNTWENMQLTNSEYDDENRVASIINYKWDGKTWTKYAKETVNYNSISPAIVKLVEVWDNGKWINSCRNYETYTTGNYFTHGVFELWTTGGWYPEDGPIHLYNPDGFELHYLAHEMLVYYDGTTSIKDEKAINLSGYVLSQNYPNPFNPSTTINYQIPSNSFVTLKVYDLLGNEVAMLVNEWKEAGSYNYELRIRNYELPSGVYFYQLRAGTFTDTKKFILLK